MTHSARLIQRKIAANGEFALNFFGPINGNFGGGGYDSPQYETC
jgi:hypothetical protein